MMSRREMLMMSRDELYPIGTGILSMFIGDKVDAGTRRNFVDNHGIDTTTGEYIERSGTYASPVYVPVSSKYTYEKNGNRLSVWAYYDKDKQFVQAGEVHNNLNTETISKFPDNVCYIRVQAQNWAGQMIEITRIE